MQPQKASEVPRFGTDHFIGSFCQPPVDSGSLTIEDTVPEKTIEALRKKGHNVSLTSVFPSDTVLTVWQENGSKKPGGDLHKGKSIATY